MSEFDIVVRGGTIVDGTGAEQYEGDVAIAGGRIAALGKLGGKGRQEIDARERIALGMKAAGAGVTENGRRLAQLFCRADS